VAAAPDRGLQIICLRELQRGGDVLRIHAAGNRRGPAVDQQVETEPRPLILAVCGCEHIAAQPLAKLGQVLGHPI
jgi:hypothetical protein